MPRPLVGEGVVDDAPRTARGARSLLRNVALAAGVGLATLVVAEGLLRLALPSPPRWKFPQEAYVYDDEIGHALRPNQTSYTHDKPVETNSQGIRDHEVPEVAPPGTTRVLALGDSQTFGNGIDLADTWPKQLERQLNARRADRSSEVLNCGIPGTDTWQHEIVLRRLLGAYHPTLAVVAVYPNDVSKAFRPDPSYALPTNTLAKRLGYCFKSSAVITVALQGARGLRAALSPGADVSRERAIVGGGHDPLVDEGWQQIEKSLGAMKRECDEAGARLVVLVIPRRDEVMGIEKSRAFDERVRTIADHAGIPCVVPLDALADEYRRSRQAMFIAWDGHNSGIANRVIAQQLAAALDSLLAAHL